MLLSEIGARHPKHVVRSLAKTSIGHAYSPKAGSWLSLLIPRRPVADMPAIVGTDRAVVLAQPVRKT
jgi:hypothetical protein